MSAGGRHILGSDVSLSAGDGMVGSYGDGAASGIVSDVEQRSNLHIAWQRSLNAQVPVRKRLGDEAQFPHAEVLP